MMFRKKNGFYNGLKANRDYLNHFPMKISPIQRTLI